VDRDRLRTQRRTLFDKRGSRPRTGIWDSSHTLVTFALLRGARCGKAARRDLRGGREVIPVPTATAAKIRFSGVPTPSRSAEGNTGRGAIREPCSGPCVV
jgi:hypothetical protein